MVEHAGATQVITSATRRVRSYDLATGKLLWEASGMTDNAIPTPVHAGGLVYLASGFRGNAMFAVRLADAQGDLTGTPAIVWRLDRDTPYVPSPLLYDDKLYLLKSNNGILSCLDAKTGRNTTASSAWRASRTCTRRPWARAGVSMSPDATEARR